MNKLTKLITVILILSLSMFACAKDNESSNNNEPLNNINVTLDESSSKVDIIEEVGNVILTGSSTLAPVVTKLTKEFSDTHILWENIDEKYSPEKIQISINGGGSGAGTKAIIEGTANFGLVSRPVKDSEKELISDYNEYKLGTDALTISINPENKLFEYQDSLSTAELQKIFSGEYKTWNDVNSKLPSDAIVLVTRDIGGGAHGVFQKVIMGDLDVSEEVIQAPSMGALITKIINNKNAIGYASFGVVNQNEGKVIPMNVDGVKPSSENIISGAYKISRPLLVITSGDLNPQEEEILQYLLSDRGMEIVTELGFVSEK